MGEKTHVILSVKAYEDVLNYLSTTQVYGNVAQLISELVNNANENTKNFSIVANNMPENPEMAKSGLQVAKGLSEGPQAISE